MSDHNNDIPLMAAMDSLSTPVLITDSDMRVRYLNTAGRQLASERGPLLEAKRCGDALQCINALKSGGCCGETEECPDCTIRQAVTTACQGQTSVAARAYIRRDTGDGDRYVHSFIKVSGFRHGGEALAAVLLQDIPEMLEATGLLRLCAWCHKVADESDSWVALSEYLARDLSLKVSHGMCPDCFARLNKNLNKPPA